MRLIFWIIDFQTFDNKSKIHTEVWQFYELESFFKLIDGKLIIKTYPPVRS